MRRSPRPARLAATTAARPCPTPAWYSRWWPCIRLGRSPQRSGIPVQPHHRRCRSPAIAPSRCRAEVDAAAVLSPPRRHAGCWLPPRAPTAPMCPAPRSRLYRKSRFVEHQRDQCGRCIDRALSGGIGNQQGWMRRRGARARTGQREHGGRNGARCQAAQQPGHCAGVSARRPSLFGLRGRRRFVRCRGHGAVRVCALSRSIIYYVCT